MATKKKPTTLLQTLKAVRSLVSTRWIKGDYRRKMSDGKLSYCLVGALRKVDGPFENNARLLIKEALPKSFGFIEYFNDYSGTTHEKMLAVVDKAITKARPKRKKARRG